MASHDSEPGYKRLKEFKVKRLLGKGAFGDVYLVQRKSDAKEYALKKVAIGSMSEREVLDALNEVRFLAATRHPNVIGFLEAFLNERKLELCVVMEYADGGDLAEKVSKHQKARRYMNETQIWVYFLQILEGLQALHEKKILHRDLKSANCFLTREGKLKIGDLNVSKLAKAGLVKTQIGTPYYMSPEIWHNRPYDAKSDIWAAGCILYELAALRPPFRGVDLEDLARRVQAGYYPRIPSQYSMELDHVIRSCLQQSPARRPSADDLLAMPAVAKWRAQVKASLDGTLISELGNMEAPDMLATIQVPRNLKRLTNALPDPCYPDTRPDSPSAWPVGAKERRQRLAAVGEEDETTTSAKSHPHAGKPERAGDAHTRMSEPTPVGGAGGGASRPPKHGRRALPPPSFGPPLPRRDGYDRRPSGGAPAYGAGAHAHGAAADAARRRSSAGYGADPPHAARAAAPAAAAAHPYGVAVAQPAVAAAAVGRGAREAAARRPSFGEPGHMAAQRRPSAGSNHGGRNAVAPARHGGAPRVRDPFAAAHPSGADAPAPKPAQYGFGVGGSAAAAATPPAGPGGGGHAGGYMVPNPSRPADRAPAHNQHRAAPMYGRRAHAPAPSSVADGSALPFAGGVGLGLEPKRFNRSPVRGRHEPRRESGVSRDALPSAVVPAEAGGRDDRSFAQNAYANPARYGRGRPAADYRQRPVPAAVPAVRSAYSNAYNYGGGGRGAQSVASARSNASSLPSWWG